VERRGGGVGGTTAGGRALVLGACEPVRYGVQQTRYGAVVKKRLGRSTCRLGCGLGLAEEIVRGSVQFSGVSGSLPLMY